MSLGMPESTRSEQPPPSIVQKAAPTNVLNTNSELLKELSMKMDKMISLLSAIVDKK